MTLQIENVLLVMILSVKIAMDLDSNSALDAWQGVILIKIIKAA